MHWDMEEKGRASDQDHAFERRIAPGDQGGGAVLIAIPCLDAREDRPEPGLGDILPWPFEVDRLTRPDGQEFVADQVQRRLERTVRQGQPTKGEPFVHGLKSGRQQPS